MQREKSLFWRGRSDYPLVDTERCRQEFFWRANSLVLTGLSRSMPIRVVPASLLFSTQGVFSDTVTQGAAQIPSIGVVIQNTWVYAPKIPPLRFIVSTQRSSFARTLPAAPKISTPEQQKVLPAYIGQEHSVLGYKLVNYRCCCSIFLSFPINSNLVNPAHLKMFVVAGAHPVAMRMATSHMGRHLPTMPAYQIPVGHFLYPTLGELKKL